MGTSSEMMEVKTILPPSATLSQLCNRRDSAHLRLSVPEPAVSCKHSSVTWMVSHISTTYCHYPHGD